MYHRDTRSIYVVHLHLMGMEAVQFFHRHRKLDNVTVYFADSYSAEALYKFWSFRCCNYILADIVFEDISSKKVNMPSLARALGISMQSVADTVNTKTRAATIETSLAMLNLFVLSFCLKTFTTLVRCLD